MSVLSGRGRHGHREQQTRIAEVYEGLDQLLRPPRRGISRKTSVNIENRLKIHATKSCEVCASNFSKASPLFGGKSKFILNAEDILILLLIRELTKLMEILITYDCLYCVPFFLSFTIFLYNGGIDNDVPGHAIGWENESCRHHYKTPSLPWLDLYNGGIDNDVPGHAIGLDLYNGGIGNDVP